MDTTERVTVTLPKDLVRGIARVEANRSRFIARAVEHELARRRHEELRRSLDAPHAEGRDLAEEGLVDWGTNLPEGDEDLVDMSSGTPVQWIEGRGWVEEPR
jgi:hypothetical protein